MNTEKMLAIILAAVSLLLIISIAALILLLSKNKKKDSELLLQRQEDFEQKSAERLTKLGTEIAAQFSQNRMENAQTQSAQRQELSAALSEMSEKIEKSARDSYDSNVKSITAISQSLSQIRQSNEEKLEAIRLTVDEKLNVTLTKRLDSSFRSVSEQLENVYKSLGEMKALSGGMTENVTALNRILTNVKARGTWAEVQLDGLLSQTIPGRYERNFMPNPASRDVVEFAVKIPSGEGGETYLPIDSKFPVEDYIRLCSAADSGDSKGVEAARKSLEARVLSQAKDVKKYINEPRTTPFAILYLATEGLYSEIISSKSGIAERCQTELGVMIAGPSTITALLNSLAVGFRAVAVNEKAKEVRSLLAAARAQYEKFGGLLEKARRKIDEAGKTLDDVQSRNGIIQKKLRSVGEMEQGEADSILGIESGDDE